jgi:hypothetical protein
LVLWVAQSEAASVSAPITLLGFPPEGATLALTVYAPGLRPTGDLDDLLVVPPEGDSAPVRFGFVADRAGTHLVRVRAFQNGVYLGQLELQVEVETTAKTQATVSRMQLAPTAAASGQVTLQVNVQGSEWRFQLMGTTFHRAVSASWRSEPLGVIDELVGKISDLARGKTSYARPDLVRHHLMALGTRLWRDVLPPEVRQQFWQEADHIQSLVVMSDLPSVPWELMHALDDDKEMGFIAEKLPLTRGVYEMPPVDRIRLDGAAYILPPKGPSDAQSELDDIREQLAGLASDRGTIADLQDLHEVLADPPALLHFACHNTSSDHGSAIDMEGGPVSPDDLALYRSKRAYSDRAPLVFLNACRTVAETAGFSLLTGWPDAFMGAGSAAFVGTLWPVRSPAAREYAGAFYRQLAAGTPLGEAGMRARLAIEPDLEDPTWLAYTVYGSPTACLAR